MKGFGVSMVVSKGFITMVYKVLLYINVLMMFYYLFQLFIVLLRGWEWIIIV